MNISASCRICSCSLESIQHILSACPVLAKQAYIERHNIMGKHIHQAYCKKYKYNILKSKEQHIPKVMENKTIKIMWDMPILTNKSVTANRLDEMSKSVLIIDFSIPWDSGVDEKYREKISKHLPLSKEIKMLYQLQEICILPIIIGCLGTYSAKKISNFVASILT